MQLTLNAHTALRITRSIRNGTIRASFDKRCELVPPSPQPARRWSARFIDDQLSFLGGLASTKGPHQLDVLVSKSEQRLRVKGVKCLYRTGIYPEGSFVDLGKGIVMSGPELLFVELARTMDPVAHLLLGMELCGRFSRDAEQPQNGGITYDVRPVTNVERLRTFAQKAHWIRGAELALNTIDHIVENAWSPMEALLAARIVQEPDDLGYDLWPIDLNPRQELGEHLARLSDVESRVPDIMFRGTKVGLNYDGEDHFRLRSIARAAIEADRCPEDSSRSRELEDTLAEARRCIVADKRRDRDLMAMGLTVFSVTKEDLEEEGGLDRVMLQVIEAIEGEGKRDLSAQRQMLRNVSRAAARQELIWSLMPGQRSESARKRLENRKAELALTREFEFAFERDGGAIRVVSLVEV